MSIRHLIVFVNNADIGTLKPALTIAYGKSNAFSIYQEVLKHSAAITIPVLAHRKCYYSNYIQNNDEFLDEFFEKQLQKGDDLGERFYSACKCSFGEWAEKVVVITGADCYDLNSGIIEEAFKVLDSNDIALGPTFDGGYYLIGMRQLIKPIFENKTWNTENLLLDTLIEISKLKLSYYLLPTLGIVENPKDLNENLLHIINQNE